MSRSTIAGREKFAAPHVTNGGMTRIRVSAPGGGYDVAIEAGSLARAGESIAAAVGRRRLFVIADATVWSFLGGRLSAALQGREWTLLKTDLGERRKRLSTVEELCSAMHAAGADRGCAVVAFGGGVAGDVAGFVAACYMRGVDVVQIPTTLLAQVDASVGGKTGVNLASGKNLAGAFHQPRLVLIDPATLDTLPDREYRAGLQEVIKHGIIRSAALFDFVNDRREAVLARDPAAVEHIVAESVRIKAAVVAEDEREAGLRRILNFGHTLGHALEAETAYRRLLHGEAVAYGMIAAGRLSELRGRLDAASRERIEAAVGGCIAMPSLADLSARSIAARVGGDKKAVGGKARFVLADAIGKVGDDLDPPAELVVAAAEHALQVSRRMAAA